VRSFGRAIGVDSSSVSNYETGKTRPDDERAARIAEVLGLDEVQTRRSLGLWVPPDGWWPSVDEFVARTSLTAKSKATWRRQYDELPKELPDLEPVRQEVIDTLIRKYGVSRETALRLTESITSDTAVSEDPQPGATGSHADAG
jgi:transcriptional regulator with XRE-family HTH domain